MREGVSIPPDPPSLDPPMTLISLFSAIYIVVFKIVSYEVWKLFICIIIGKLICSGNAGVFSCMHGICVSHRRTIRKKCLKFKRFLLFVVLVIRIFSTDIAISCQS